MGFASNIFAFVFYGRALMINLFLKHTELVVLLIQEHLEVFAHQIVLAQVLMNAKMENAGIFTKYIFHTYPSLEILSFRCPSNSGSFGGFCSSSCSCSSPYECQNGKCGFLFF
jgi:hypothetical protein